MSQLPYLVYHFELSNLFHLEYSRKCVDVENITCSMEILTLLMCFPFIHGQEEVFYLFKKINVVTLGLAIFKELWYLLETYGTNYLSLCGRPVRDIWEPFKKNFAFFSGCCGGLGLLICELVDVTSRPYLISFSEELICIMKFSSARRSRPNGTSLKNRSGL